LELEKLLAALPQKRIIALGKAADIIAIVYSSHKATPDALFVAVVGFHTDGHSYISDAVQRGAIAIVGCNAELLEQFVASPDYNGVTVIQVDDEREALANLAACFYGYPARQLNVIGVTGTDGKTTTTFLISAMLDSAGRSTGLIGTVDFKVGARRWSNASRQTTPEAVEVQELLAQMVAEKVPYAVLESTSHALALRKLLNCGYDVAVLTNVTQDHLDYHGSLEQYRRDKARLFGYLTSEPPKPFVKFPKTAIVNADDPNAALFLETAGPQTNHLTYAIYNPAEVRATEIVATASRLEYTLNSPAGNIRLNLRLPGEFNVYNSMAAACVGLSQGLTLAEIKTGLESVAGVPGRMQTVEEGQPFAVVVDYAHTPDSLAKVLNILRPLTTGKLITVFGSAGERDRVKRPLQGEIAARLADFAVFTNEDPRLEDENQILDEIAVGAERIGWQEHQNFLKIADRRAAIEAAVARAKEGDTILLAGKGHEQSIIMNGYKIPWDELTEARTAIEKMYKK